MLKVHKKFCGRFILCIHACIVGHNHQLHAWVGGGEGRGEGRGGEGEKRGRVEMGEKEG